MNTIHNELDKIDRQVKILKVVALVLVVAFVISFTLI